MSLPPKTCPNCTYPVEITASQCPHCGYAYPVQVVIVNAQKDPYEWARTHPKQTLVAVVAAMLVFMALFAWFGSLTSSNSGLELIGGSTGWSSGTIYGTIHNGTGHNVSYAQVDVNLYDSSGNQVGNTLANVADLAADKDWNFTAPVLEESASNFKIVKITGF